MKGKLKANCNCFFLIIPLILFNLFLLNINIDNYDVQSNNSVRSTILDYSDITNKDMNMHQLVNYIADKNLFFATLIKKVEPINEEETDLPKTNTKAIVTNSSKKIEKTLSIEQQILKRNDKLGSAGRLYFSSLYSVALYNTSLFDPNIQKVVDNKDSAAYFEYGNTYLIGDHNNQGFSIIKKQNIGSKIYIKSSNGQIRTFSVVEKINGYNYGDRLVTKDGRDVKDIKASFVMYTCNSVGGRNVTIVICNEINAKKTVEKKVEPLEEVSKADNNLVKEKVIEEDINIANEEVIKEDNSSIEEDNIEDQDLTKEEV